MNEEDLPPYIAEARRIAAEAKERQGQLIEKEPPDILSEHIQAAKVSAWVTLAGWCGFYFLQQINVFAEFEFLKIGSALFFLAGLLGTPAFLWNFIPVSILKLPTRFQFVGQVVGSSIAAFLPLACLIFFFSGPLFTVTPNIAEAKDNFLFPALVSIIIIYVSRILGGHLPWRFPPPMRQILSIRAYLIASGLSFLISFLGIENPGRGFTYLFFLVSSYLGITIGLIEQHYGFAKRREARALQRILEKAVKQAKKNTQNISEDKTQDIGPLEKEQSDFNLKKTSQEVTKQDLIDEMERKTEENSAIKNEYAAFLQTKEGSRFFGCEEDLPYSKEKIKTALLMGAAIIAVYVEKEELVKEAITIYHDTFLMLAKFFPKEEFAELQKFMSFGEKAQNKELLEKEEIRKIVQEISNINRDKLNIKMLGEKMIEERKKLKIEWEVEMMKYISWYATIKKMAENS